MVIVIILFKLMDGWVVEYNTRRYLLGNEDIYFNNNTAYTYLNKLNRPYHMA